MTDGDRTSPPSDRHIWELQPVRDLFWIGLGLACLGAAYVFRSATYPALVALILAYWLTPSVSWASERLGVSRRVVGFLAFATVLGLTVLFWVLVAPLAVAQLSTLATEVPPQLEQAFERFGLPEILSSEASSAVDLRGTLRQMAGGASELLSSITSAISAGSSFLVQVVFGVALFYYFVVNFDSLPDATVYIPSAIRAQTVDLLGRFEDAFFGFLRGQLMVALFTTTAFAIGFSLVGVPFALIAAVIGGLLSFIPYGQAAGPISAVAFGLLGAAEGGQAVDWVAVVVLPLVVYAVSQSMETFIITPIVQGSATKLNPLVIFGALICGGAIGGILGVFLAIPIAACSRILFEEVVLPGFRRVANPEEVSADDSAP